MSKLKTPNQKKIYNTLNKSIHNDVSNVLLSAEVGLSDKAARLVTRISEDDRNFKFAEHRYAKKEIDDMFSDFVSEIGSFVKKQQKMRFFEANKIADKTESIVKEFYKEGKNRSHIPVEYAMRTDVLSAFQNRRDNGMGLSERLWRLQGDYRTAIEDAISVAIRKGQGPVALAHRITKYLQEYDSLNAEYKKKFNTARKAKDCHYAAMRLAFTEIQMAYRTAEQHRWLEMDEVVGMRIRTHGSKHKNIDMCDELAGDYPKSFMWLGWHPMCHCYAVPIFRDEGKKDGGEVSALPSNMKDWVDGNIWRIAGAEERGTMPYFLRDNPSLWTDGVRRYRYNMQTGLIEAVLRGGNSQNHSYGVQTNRNYKR